MIYRKFGKTGFNVSVVGMGTFYDAGWIALAIAFKVRLHKSRILDALKTGLDMGINFIDTAEIYQSEPVISQAIKGRKRDELFIASKVWRSHLEPDQVSKACRKSLERLNTSYLDLYQVHFPNPKVRIKETMGALEKLVDDGLVRAIGISNFSYPQMIEAESALSHHELCSTQMHYNILNREVEKEILPHCEKEGIAMIPYYPLAHGRVAKQGKIQEIALRHGTSSASVALDWLIKRSQENFPIPRASRPNHVREDALAPAIELTDGEMQELDKTYPVSI